MKCAQRYQRCEKSRASRTAFIASSLSAWLLRRSSCAKDVFLYSASISFTTPLECY